MGVLGVPLPCFSTCTRHDGAAVAAAATALFTAVFSRPHQSSPAGKKTSCHQGGNLCSCRRHCQSVQLCRHRARLHSVRDVTLHTRTCARLGRYWSKGPDTARHVVWVGPFAYMSTWKYARSNWPVLRARESHRCGRFSTKQINLWIDSLSMLDTQHNDHKHRLHGIDR